MSSLPVSPENLHGQEWHRRAIRAILVMPVVVGKYDIPDKYEPKWPPRNFSDYWAMSHNKVFHLLSGFLIESLCIHSAERPGWTMNRHWHPNKGVHCKWTVPWCPCCQARRQPVASLSTACEYCLFAMTLSRVSRWHSDIVSFYGAKQPRWRQQGQWPSKGTHPQGRNGNNNWTWDENGYKPQSSTRSASCFTEEEKKPHA